MKRRKHPNDTRQGKTSKRGSGNEYWKSRLHRGGEEPGRFTKKLTHRKERREERRAER